MANSLGTKMSYVYLIAPFLTWFIAGSLKFLVNSIRSGNAAYKLVGYGGLPSNHSAIVTCMVTLISFKEGIENPAFGVSLTLAFIVILDASSLRRQVGEHATRINLLNQSNNGYNPLRERIGHSRIEIAAGIAVGMVVGFILAMIF